MSKIYEIIREQLIKLNEQAERFEFKTNEYEQFIKTYRARHKRALAEIKELEEALKKLDKQGAKKLRKVA